MRKNCVLEEDLSTTFAPMPTSADVRPRLNQSHQ